ncbi:HlyD family secretion protein [Polycladidibacter stylochi]|uniref:HlyD family secretion protein n=1 Tax=Polycladidibacter stylochi TaxID=1807766 RepID=UPI00082F26E9|nr:HlyD family secretion protein [Pseudovibrio stylochi]
METLMLLTYAALCVVAFKVLKIPVTGYTVTTASIGGFLLVGAIIVAMNYSHPTATVARTFYRTTPIISTHRALVVDVWVKPNTLLHKGEKLFAVDSFPFETQLRTLKARRAQVVADYEGKKQALIEAEAQVKTAKASLELARIRFDDARDLATKDVGTVAAVQFREQELESALAALQSAYAARETARITVNTKVADGTVAEIEEIDALIAKEEWNIKHATIFAPEDGYATNFAIKPGFMARRLFPSMVFISKQRRDVVASFLQIHMQQLKPGDEVEVAFIGIPGRIFKAKIYQLVDYIAAGQLEPTGTLIAPETRAAPGRINAIIRIEDDMSQFDLPGGAYAHVAVYTETLVPLQIIRRILLRMQAWLNYLSFDH